MRIFNEFVGKLSKCCGWMNADCEPVGYSRLDAGLRQNYVSIFGEYLARMVALFESAAWTLWGAGKLH